MSFTFERPCHLPLSDLVVYLWATLSFLTSQSTTLFPLTQFMYVLSLTRWLCISTPDWGSSSFLHSSLSWAESYKGNKIVHVHGLDVIRIDYSWRRKVLEPTYSMLQNTCYYFPDCMWCKIFIFMWWHFNELDLKKRKIKHTSRIFGSMVSMCSGQKSATDSWLVKLWVIKLLQ